MPEQILGGQRLCLFRRGDGLRVGQTADGPGLALADWLLVEAAGVVHRPAWSWVPGTAGLEGTSEAGGLGLAASLSLISAGDAEHLRCDLRLNNAGVNPLEVRVRVRLVVDDPGPVRWMIPGPFYKDNRPQECVRRYPRYAPEVFDPGSFVSPYWAFRSDRAALPAVFCWSPHLLAFAGTTEDFAGPRGLYPSGLHLDGDRREGRSVTALGCDFPYREEPRSYRHFRPHGPEPDSPDLPLEPGQSLEAQLWFGAVPRDPGSDGLYGFAPYLRYFYDRQRPENPPNPWMPKPEAERLCAYGLAQWHYDPERHVLYETAAFDRYFGHGPEHVDRPHMHVSWVSGIPYAWMLAHHGAKVGIPSYIEAGCSVIDKVVREGISPHGLFWAEWRREDGWGTGWNPDKNWLQARTSAEATTFLLRAADEFQRDDWRQAARRNLDFARGVQRGDGNFGSYYDARSGEVTVWDGCAGMAWIPALLGDPTPAHIEAAERAGAYYARFVEDAYLYGAPEDVHLTPTSEDGYNALLAYMLLYEAGGRRNPEWLRLARLSAEWMLTFRWTYNVRFPEHTLLGTYGFSTFGADLASPSNHHLHDYGLIAHPELLRLYACTGDLYWLRRAADLQLCFLQFIARQDGDFGARCGMVSEQWMHTDWTHPKGSLLALAHSWCAGLILYAADYTQGFGDLVVDLRTNEVVALEAVDAHLESTSTGFRLRVRNRWDRDLELRVAVFGASGLRTDLPTVPAGAGMAEGFMVRVPARGQADVTARVDRRG